LKILRSTRDDLLNCEIRDSRAVRSTSGHSATGNEIRARTYVEWHTAKSPS